MPIGLALISYSVVLLVTALGIRLLLIARKSRGLPELLIAIYFLASGPLGYGLLLLPAVAPESVMETAWRLADVGRLHLAIPAVTICLFTWRVFRPDRGWAAAVAIGLGLGVIATALAQPAPATPLFWLERTGRVAAFGWAALESSLHYRTALRRVEIGLVAPLVANRFLLWAIWSGAALAMVALSTTSNLLYERSAPFTSGRIVLTILTIAAGLTCGLAVWITFFPPAFYRRRVESRAPAS